MCIVCVEYAKGKMTPDEGLRAVGEMAPTMDDEHFEEVTKMLLDEWWLSWTENMPQTD